MRVQSKVRRFVQAMVVLGIGTACADGIIYDDFGIAGYARLRGTVTRADGSAFASGTLNYQCGDPEPTWFGSQATTSPTGTFDIAVNARPAGTLPPSGELVCEVSAVTGSAVLARGRARVQFSQDAAARPIALFVLVEGQAIP